MSKTRRRAIAAFCKRVADLQGVYFDFYYMEKLAPDEVLLDRFDRAKAYLERNPNDRASELLAATNEGALWTT